MPEYWMVTVEDYNISWSYKAYHKYTAFIDIHPSMWIQDEKRHGNFILFAMKCSKEAYDLHWDGSEDDE